MNHNKKSILPVQNTQIFLHANYKISMDYDVTTYDNHLYKPVPLFYQGWTQKTANFFKIHCFGILL